MQNPDKTKRHKHPLVAVRLAKGLGPQSAPVDVPQMPGRMLEWRLAELQQENALLKQKLAASDGLTNDVSRISTQIKELVSDVEVAVGRLIQKKQQAVKEEEYFQAGVIKEATEAIATMLDVLVDKRDQGQRTTASTEAQHCTAQQKLTAAWQREAVKRRAAAEFEAEEGRAAASDEPGPISSAICV